MTNLISRLYHDEAGFIVSCELVLIATVGVLAMVVGLSEVAININNELEDVGSAFGSLNQSFRVGGSRGHQGGGEGSGFGDGSDHCDRSGNIRPGSPSNRES
jgi:Flp pilus assembly pilin Flp